MTDPMELVGRLENIETGSFPYVASAAAEAAACIREMVEVNERQKRELIELQNHIDYNNL